MKIETPILKRLGPIPFWRSSEKCLDSLEVVYRRAALHAGKLLARNAAAAINTKPAVENKSGT